MSAAVGISRREFIAALGGAVVAWPLKARAQQTAMPTIGYLSQRSSESDVGMLAAFREGLNEGGFVEGKNVAIEFRWGDGQPARLPMLAEDLVRRGVATIVTSGSEMSALAAKAATRTIPIVFNVGGDPIATGLVVSLQHPGGNATGVTSFQAAVGAKRLGLLREVVPTANSIAFLLNPDNPAAEPELIEVQTAVAASGLQIIVLRANTEPEIEAAFELLAKRRADALLVGASPLFMVHANKLVSLSAHYAVPTMYFRSEFTAIGGLMSYASSTAEMYREMGLYAAKILKGEKPSELPVLQPTKFEFVINLKTAETLGLTIPSGVLSIADDVIE